ncbi:MAG: Asp-tRNA(Asn)/Glu-tRNA(Gln) amidotransferase subunit GatB [bacterium]
MNQKYQTIIGLEIHVQLKTKSKMFCGCDNTGEGKKPNTTICEICTAQPGTLPVPNDQAIRWGVLAALALNCQVAPVSKFDRKHYFYPDLPKGYQISQYDQPIGSEGYLDIGLGDQAVRIRIERLHLEEDSAKLLHEPGQKDTFIDFNRAGTPLAEIVTKPDIASPEQARIFLQELKMIMQYLGVSDADMEKGQLRVDANISLRPMDDTKLYSKTEVKNINSFKAVEKALAFEVIRLTKLWDEGKPPKLLATRGWEETKNETVEQRVKEESADYRYFPEPDIPPLKFTREYLDSIQAEMPELPAARKARFQSEYGFTVEDVQQLISDQDIANYAEEVISELRAWLKAENVKDSGVTWQLNKEEFSKLAANWLINRYMKLARENKLAANKTKITAENMAEFIKLVWQGSVGSRSALVVLEEMFKTGGDPSDIIEKKQLGQMSDEASLHAVIDKVIQDNPKEVEQYKAGKITLAKFLMGKIMQETQGRADPEKSNRLLIHKLK